MKTILIVDDEARFRVIFGQILERRGFHVITANDALQAHQILKETPKVDLVLLDINMPEIHGDILYEVMQSFHYKSRVIVCSVLPVEEQSRIIPDAVDYYDKSEDFLTLLQKIEMVFGKETFDKKILIIDDDAHIRSLYRKFLMRAGYFPIDVGDHPETFRFLRKQIQNIDLILLDIAMPNISGLEYFNMIREEYPQARVMVTSVFTEDQQRTFIRNADDYFDKSGSHKVLLEKVKCLLN